MPKIKLLEVPENITLQTWSEQVTYEEEGATKEKTVEHKKNTNEVALILLKVPQQEIEEEVKVEAEPAQGDESGEPPAPKTKIIKKMVDMD
mmetsp:Transcript_3700/g.5577  ORF Transcript_3700/g.5577 Transcript_3700/m.5577 type:complete len:91 (-) Transcript_3700:129-401(-)